MKENLKKRLLSGFLAMAMTLTMFCPSAVSVYAEDLEAPNTEIVVATGESATVQETTPEAKPEAKGMTEAAQEFVDSVKSIDRVAFYDKSNAFGLASQAWQADKGNADLEQKAAKASEESEIAAQPILNAINLYEELSADEQKLDEVEAAYQDLMVVWLTGLGYQENPIKEGLATGGDAPSVADVGKNLYGDLPDAPTGYYLSESGYPIATGDTKIGIAPFTDKYSEGFGDFNLNATTLNGDNFAAAIHKTHGDYAVFAISTEVEYPENGSSTTLELSDGAELISVGSVSWDRLETVKPESYADELNSTYTDVSSAAKTYFVKSGGDFSATFRYIAPNGEKLEKKMTVKVADKVTDETNAYMETTKSFFPEGENNSTKLVNNFPGLYAISGDYGAAATLVQTEYTQKDGVYVRYAGTTPMYCCDHGASSPNGTVLAFTHYSTLTPDQAKLAASGDPFAIQVGIWGGLGQLALNILDEKRDVSTYTASEFALGVSDDSETQNAYQNAYKYYTDAELWIIRNFPNSEFAEILVNEAGKIESAKSTTYNSELGGGDPTGGITACYEPIGGGGQQRQAVIVKILYGETGEPEVPDTPFEKDFPSLVPQTASGNFTFNYNVNTDKIQRDTFEKVDGAEIVITPTVTGGTIAGGTWSMTPATSQTVNTTGHTNDENYQNNGGDGRVSWSVTYSVTKTAGENREMTAADLGKTEDEINAMSLAEFNSLVNGVYNTINADNKAAAESAVDAAIAQAKGELASLAFTYYENGVPYGFNFDNGESGSDQTINVANDQEQHFKMNNDEWSVQVVLDKVDSETGNRIENPTNFEVYEWDVVNGKYMPNGGYNQYSVDRNADGSYYVANHSAYATGNDNSGNPKDRTMYYTQRNEGKFIIVERQAPAGYYGDWTDLEHPGEAGSIVGKRAYYIEITEANNGQVIELGNEEYSADIGTVEGYNYPDGQTATLQDSKTGGEVTVHIYKASNDRAATVNYQDSNRVYNTDVSGKAANEDQYHTVHGNDTPRVNKFQNDRTLGEISMSKVDLDAIRYVDGRDTKDDAMKSGQAHADASLDGAVYDLYVADKDILHPDGKMGVVDYSQLKYLDGDQERIWHTTVRTNYGEWVTDYLPVLKAGHLVASAEMQDGWINFSNLYLGKYVIVERGTGVVMAEVEVNGNVFTAEESHANKVHFITDGKYPSIKAEFVKVGEKEDTQHETITDIYKWVVNRDDANKLDLAKRANGEYSTWIYRNQFSSVAGLKQNDDGNVSDYDLIYASYAEGYLCDETNYYLEPTYTDESVYVEKLAFEDNRQHEEEARDTTEYSDYYHIVKNNTTNESHDQVMKSDIIISKVGTDSSSQNEPVDFMDGAGFTLYLISDLSVADKLATMKIGGKTQYILDDVLKYYYNPNYNDQNPKYDFSKEAQAIAKSYERDKDEIDAYNKTLTQAGTFSNGKGEGWVATGRVNEYQLSELFSVNGRIGIKGLPYGQYLLVETTTPKSRYQAEPILIDIDPVANNDAGVLTPNSSSCPISSNADIKVMADDASVATTGNLATGFGGYLRYLVNNESVDTYLRITKMDEETGKPVLREGTAWQLYRIDTNGKFLDKDGNPINLEQDKDNHPALVTMTGTVDGSAMKNIDTFYSNKDGVIVLPEKLPSGRYRLVEVIGPEGFYNEWLDTAQYGENGVLEQAGTHYYDFRIGTNDAETSKFRDDITTLRSDWENGEYTLGEAINKLANTDNNGIDYAVQVAARFLYRNSGDAEEVLNTLKYYVESATGTSKVDYKGNLNSVADARNLLNKTKYLENYVIYQATGEQNEDGQDNIVIDQNYFNHETLGQLTIRKLGEVLKGFDKEAGKFTYEVRPVPGATYTITAAEDIYTQDNQVDANGNRTLWYAKGDTVATVTTGDGTAWQGLFGTSPTTSKNDTEWQNRFYPTRTPAQYDFMSVTTTDGGFDEESGEWYGGFGEVTVKLPLGKYEIKETKAPFGYTLNDKSYTVEFTWDSQMHDVVMASEITETVNGETTTTEFPVTDANDLYSEYGYVIEGIDCTAKLNKDELKNENAEQMQADAEFNESQVLLFYNDREKARLGVYKQDSITGKYVAGAVFALKTPDEIRNADGDVIFKKDAIIAYSPETRNDGYTYFDVDIPIQGELYYLRDDNGEIVLDGNGNPVLGDTVYNYPDKTKFNSGHYFIQESKAPDGYFINQKNYEVWFTYDSQVEQVLGSTIPDKPSVMHFSKTDLTNGKELPGATISVIDKHGNTVQQFVSGSDITNIYGLSFNEDDWFILRETRPAPGYVTAEEVKIKLVQKTDANGEKIEEVDVYFWNNNKWEPLDKNTHIMRDDITRVQISKVDITNNKELPGAHLKIEDMDGNVIEEWTSTNEPHYIEKLPIGDYKLIEITAPKGYLVAETMKFSVLDTGEIQHFTMYDKPDETGILIHKIDSATKQIVEGAEFQILDAKTKEVVVYHTPYGKDVTCYNKTNASGNIWFGLDFGNYYYQEIHAAPGYRTDTALVPFTIDKDHQRVEVIVENDRTPLYGIIAFFKNKFKKPNGGYVTGTQTNGVGTETLTSATPEQATTTPESTGVKTLGIAIPVVCVAAGIYGLVCLLKKFKKSPEDDETDIVEVSEESSEDEDSKE